MTKGSKVLSEDTLGVLLDNVPDYEEVFSPLLARLCTLCACARACRSLSIRGRQICPPSVMTMSPCNTSSLM